MRSLFLRVSSVEFKATLNGHNDKPLEFLAQRAYVPTINRGSR